MPKRPMRSLQLPLRDLFWLILIAALGLGWWVDRIKLRQEFATLEKERTALQELVKLRREMESANVELAVEQVARLHTGGGLRISTASPAD